MVIGLQFTQPGDPFGGFPISHARIGKPRHRQNGGIALTADIIVGRIAGNDPVIRFRCDRVAPFRPFRRGEWQCVVQHRVEHVDEGHFGDDAAEGVGRHIDNRAHQHAARRTAMGDDAVMAGKTFGNKVP